MSRSPKYHITGSKLLPTQKKGGLPSTKWTTQADGVASPTYLYLCLEHKESNTRTIVSRMDAIQFHQMKTTLQRLHMERGDFYTKDVQRGKTRMV